METQLVIVGKRHNSEQWELIGGPAAPNVMEEKFKVHFRLHPRQHPDFQAAALCRLDEERFERFSPAPAAPVEQVEKQESFFKKGKSK